MLRSCRRGKVSRRGRRRVLFGREGGGKEGWNISYGNGRKIPRVGRINHHPRRETRGFGEAIQTSHSRKEKDEKVVGLKEKAWWGEGGKNFLLGWVLRTSLFRGRGVESWDINHGRDKGGRFASVKSHRKRGKNGRGK